MVAFTNAKINIPPLFQEIIKIDDEISNIQKNLVIEFTKIRELKKRKQELRKAAQETLHWNIFNGKAR